MSKKKKSTKISMSVFPRLFLFYRVFGCFSATGVQKHYKKHSEKIVSKLFYKKSMSKTFPKISTKFRCQFFLDFFCFIAFSGVFQRWEFKSTTKNVLQKRSCRKGFTKSPKPTFSRFCFITFLGVCW